MRKLADQMHCMPQVSEVHAYRSISEVSPNTRDLMIQVRTHRCVYDPVFHWRDKLHCQRSHEGNSAIGSLTCE